MNKTQLRSTTVLVLLWLSIGMSCHNESAEPCKNGECCWSGYKNTITRRVEGSRAGLIGGSFIFEDQAFKSQHYSASICPIQAQELKAMNLENNLGIDSRIGSTYIIDSTRLYPYKVWGTMYLIDIPNTLFATYGFRIDRVEKVQ